jgi:hypothetical protein
MKQSKWIVEIEQTESTEALVAIGDAVRSSGYTGFYEIQDYIREQFKRYEESDITSFQTLIERVQVAVPEPGVISPSWTYFWDEIARMRITKDGLFQQVPVADRDGEWQVIIDNPFSHDNVACYPKLSFLEGAYLYCYFFLNLKKNEYVRLQKIVTAVQTHGK